MTHRCMPASVCNGSANICDVMMMTMTVMMDTKQAQMCWTGKPAAAVAAAIARLTYIIEILRTLSDCRPRGCHDAVVATASTVRYVL